MKILISDKIHNKGVDLLREKGFSVDEKFDLSSKELEKILPNYDIIIVRSRTKLNQVLLKKAKKLKVIGRAGVGLDNIDLKTCERLNIKVMNTPEAPSVSVAELTIGLILNLLRRIPKANSTMHCGEWCKKELLGETLYRKKVGIVGFGNIGMEVAKRLNSFQANIGIYDVDPERIDIGIGKGYIVFKSLEELIAACEIVSLHIPVNRHTRKIIDQRCINIMGKDTILINTARGELIDEDALLNALKENKIKGAALDVFCREPLGEHDMCNCRENLILTPHIGSQTIETQMFASTRIAQKIIKFFKENKK
jgi:D-3-phosphoglycerate dehydrogenase